MIRTTYVPVLVFALLFSSAAALRAQSAPATKAETGPPVIDAIDAAMKTFIERGRISGAVTLVGHQGKIVHLGAVGQADIEGGREMKRSTLFAIASMTKPITASALMILQEQGKLDLDDPISKYIPSYADLKLENGSAPNRPITLRDCVTHTAGFNSGQVFSTSLQDAVAELSTKPLAFQPGTKWKYSPGLNVAGRVIEVVSKQPFHEFLQENLFTPLELKSTTFFPDEKQARRIATIYQPGEQEGSLAAAPNHIAQPGKVTAANPSGGLFSTGRDLFRFYQMVLNDGRFRKQRILTAESVKEMTSPQTGDIETGFTPGNCWGLGWCIVRQPQGVTEMLSRGTFGHGGAFGTQGWVDPKTETIYVLLIQRTKMGNSDGSEIRKAFQQAANDALGL